MDVFWSNANALSLPSAQRVEVLVHDGASDFSLWPGPGPDRSLVDAYGPGLRDVLAVQRDKHEGGIALGDVVRVHPGKLHCSYLLWAACHGPEADARQARAPGLEAISAVVRRSLELAAQNGSISVAFGALGDGPGAVPPEERLAAIVRAAHRYYEECISAGRPPRVEIVRVCDIRVGVTSAARRLVGRLAHAAPEPVVKPTVSSDAPRARSTRGAASASSVSRSTSSTGRRRQVGLDPGEVSMRRASSQAYDRSHTYRDGDWFIHAKFGVGQVKRVTPEGAVEVMFEDGSTKKMLHGRAG
jgi:O-acetyl-ADP-ribose deacetylase (regulator of RNase III)